MKLSWKQLLIAAGLFLAGYFSFNGSACAGAGKTQGVHRRGWQEPVLLPAADHCRAARLFQG
jgi:hypothetical protein